MPDDRKVIVDDKSCGVQPVDPRIVSNEILSAMAMVQSSFVRYSGQVLEVIIERDKWQQRALKAEAELLKLEKGKK
jgi:hypothetical protein